MGEQFIQDFHTLDVPSWKNFIQLISKQKGRWVYRGQCEDWPLTTSLERSLGNWEIDSKARPEVERQIIREFRRQYRGSDESRVGADTLYCLALMQHHGAPTRLSDWTYSPFVAAKFAIEAAAKDAVIWCLHSSWCYQTAVSCAGQSCIEARNVDDLRDDSSFLPLYMPQSRKKKFVFLENSFHLNKRLIIQQGVFLCPGDISATFNDNLKAMSGWHLKENVVKLRLKMEAKQVREFAMMLRRMNINSAVLFPGLDGFARSLGESMFLYDDYSQRNIGDSNHRRP